jgi:hypothetical protein
METDHTETDHIETLVEKTVAYEKDKLGIPSDDRTPDGEWGSSTEPSTPEARLTDGMRLDPHADTFNKIVERSRRVDAA